MSAADAMFLEPLLDTADAEFLTEVRQFLDRELTPAMRQAEDQQRSMVADYVRGSAWVDCLRPRLWHVGHWPQEFGGAGLSAVKNYLLLYEMGRQGAAHLPPMALNYTGPIVMAFGTPAQREQILPRIIDGTDYWCQGFSEPGSGSDLASVNTFAERRGDAYVVNGSKIWTTDAHHANKIFCLVRTRRENAYDAMSFLLLDMDDPGIEVRPIQLLSGDHEFNQVFFDEVEVPVENLLGNEGDGWKIAKHLLEIERGQFVFGGRLRRRMEQLKMRAAEHNTDAAFNQELALIDIDLKAYEMSEFRLAHAADNLSNARAEASIIKIEWTEMLRRLEALALSLAGRDALYQHDGEHYRGGLHMSNWLASYLNNTAATIYAGSNEVQRNLVFRAMRKGLNT